MFKRLKNILNKEGHQHCHRGGKHTHGHGENCRNGIPKCAVPLDEAPEGKRITVVANSDLKTMEMGLYPGSVVTLVHNESQERNIIVKIHDQKYVIPRVIAKNIFVKTR
jgi:Fe2+ transport system protein FeoA